jgi:hypothetical protein
MRDGRVLWRQYAADYQIVQPIDAFLALLDIPSPGRTQASRDLMPDRVGRRAVTYSRWIANALEQVIDDVLQLGIRDRRLDELFCGVLPCS